MNLIRTYILSVFLLILFNSIQAQSFIVSGTILNAENNTPVEFANIGVENTYIGTATDINGLFQLTLTQALNDKTIRISAVGFETKTYKISEFQSNSELVIKLTPVNYGLSEVNVEAESKIGYGIIKTSANLITDNYLQKPYTYKCYIKSIKIENNSEINTESFFVLSDNQGYTTKSFTDAYKNRNYKIIENKSSDTINSFIKGLTFIDHLIDLDLVRNAGNILSENTVNDYSVIVKNKENLNGNEVWVIEYSTTNPNINNCGDPEAINVKGVLWISSNDNAILKNKCSVIRKGEFIHGNSFYNSKDITEDEIEYSYETSYKKNKGAYVLDTIDYVIKSKVYKVKIYLKVIEIDDFDENIKSRQYFNYMSSADKFRENFKSPE